MNTSRRSLLLHLATALTGIIQATKSNASAADPVTRLDQSAPAESSEPECDEDEPSPLQSPSASRRIVRYDNFGRPTEVIEILSDRPIYDTHYEYRYP